MRQLSDKTRAFWAGAFILIAYSMLASVFTQSKLIVMIFDVISGVSVVGIASLLYPYFTSNNQLLSRSYLGLKILEGSLMILGGILFLFVSTAYLRDSLYNGLHLYVFTVSAFILYYLLYQTQIVPRFISIWGLIAIAALFIKTLLGLVGIQLIWIDMLLLLVITNEFVLALWLMIKGVNVSRIK